jgi:hypothetical protein
VREAERRDGDRRGCRLLVEEAHRGALCFIEQLDRGDPNPERGGGGLDALAREITQRRPGPEHLQDTGRVEIGVHDADFFPGVRERARDVYREQALARPTLGAGENERGFDRRKIAQDGIPVMVQLFAGAVGGRIFEFGKNPHQLVTLLFETSAPCK